MGVRDDIKEVKEQIDEVRHQSLASEILSDYKKTNKRMFWIIIVILIMWFATIGYLVYILNDVGTTSKEIEIEDVEVIDNSHIRIGDDIYEVGEE